MLREADIEKINAGWRGNAERILGREAFDVEPGGFLRTGCF